MRAEKRSTPAGAPSIKRTITVLNFIDACVTMYTAIVREIAGKDAKNDLGNSFPIFSGRAISVWRLERLHGIVTSFTRRYADCIQYRRDVDLTVPTETRMGLSLDDFNDLIHHAVLDHGFDLDNGDVIHQVFGKAVGHVLSPTTAESFHVADTHSREPFNVVKGTRHGGELVWLDVGLDLFHGFLVT